MRVLLDYPADVVLRHGDLVDGFYLTLESATDSVALWPNYETEFDAPQPDYRSARAAARNTGHQTILSRRGAPAIQGLTVVESTAVRYETTALATDAFNRASASVQTSRTSVRPADVPDVDQISVWRYRFTGVVLDQALMRSRHYVLALVIVQQLVRGVPEPVATYAAVLRSKLRY